MKISGSEIFIRSLKEEKVSHIFGFPGATILGIYNQLLDSDIQHILVRHEQGAIHAADGYARASGKPGVCLVTSGPGATNTVTGVATAFMDSIPVVIFTGQVPTSMIGNDAFQEVDIVGITRSITKHNYLVSQVKDLARIIKEAFHIATTGRPGPVLVDLPRDVLMDEAEFHYPAEVSIRGYKPNYIGHPKQIEAALKLIAKAKRPVIYSGGGVIRSGARQELLELVNKTNIPTTSTLMGLGGIPGDHPRFLGMLGMHGTKYANLAVTECDLLIAIGARFDDRATGKLEKFAPKAKYIHIDIDPATISKNVRVHIPIVGDAKLILREINKAVVPGDYSAWIERIEEWKREFPLSYQQDDEIIKPQYVIEQIYDLVKDRAIIATDVGQHQMWVAHYYKFNDRRMLLTSGGLGTMGYGLPAAIGAQVACPDKLVFDIAGDGSFQMVLQELATAVQYNLPVKVAIINNQCLGMVRQWQELFMNKRYSGVCLKCAPDFVKLAESYGAVGLRASKPAEVRPVLNEAISVNKPVVIDFRVACEENVFPMVPAGAGIEEMLLS
ncbi:MAG: biosynthetic-type acetolactate synthase large subunit [bacterium]|nr:biosynthetic-type acetolactate synthase large subunit [bacterium]